jgi:hypothetical protein
VSGKRPCPTFVSEDRKVNGSESQAGKFGEEKYLLLLTGKKAAQRMNKRQCRHAKHFQDGEKEWCRQRNKMNWLDAERREGTVTRNEN